MAWSAATSASCVKRAERWASLRSMCSAGSKLRTWHANLVVSREESKPSIDAGTDQQAAKLAAQAARDLLPHGLEDEVGRGLRHLDRHVAHEAVGDDDVGPAGEDLLGLHVADEVDLRAPEPRGRLARSLVA